MIAAVAGLALSGCAASLWPAGQSASPAQAMSPAGDPITDATPAAAAPARTDAQRIEDVMAELRRLGPLDPAAHDKLLEDLRQSDPTIWPLVMQQFRATLAYRRRAAERDGMAMASVERLPPVDDVMQASYAAPLPGDGAQLSAATPLVVCHPAFCTEVLSYGCMKPFDKSEFFQNQEVLLYAEVENFASQPTTKGYHTSLHSSYQILDHRGGQATKVDFAPTEEYCQNPRHDFFIAYRLRLPKQISPGFYTLKLSIEDLNRHKTGQASIEFAVKEGKAPAIKAGKPGGK